MEDSFVTDEYGKKVPGCFRPCKPRCPYTAVIPSIVLDTKEGLRDIADCLVHVTSVNTTYYIDDKHRIITVWAGPVEVDDYDYETNPLGLRSQYVIDRQSGRMVYYNATGDYSVMPLTDPEQQVTKTYVDEQDTATLQAAKDYTDEHGGGAITFIDLTVQSITPIQNGVEFTVTSSKTLAEATPIWEAGGDVRYRLVLAVSPDPSSIATGTYEISPLYIGPNFAIGSFMDAYNGLNMSLWHEAGSPEIVKVTAYQFQPSVTVDSSLSSSSTNPVQNKVITSALNDKADSATLATVATTGNYSDLSGTPTVPVITMQSSDPGEGTPLAANNFIAVYLEEIA